MMNYMFDTEFLLALDNYQHKEKYAKITALTLDEKPIEAIEGKVTGGSINIDGASAVRRTCNLTLLAYDTKVTDFYWGLSTKFKLEIGLKNEINKNYPDIIWFKQGTYSITSFSSSISGANYNISISGKDKMCLLNGELGGIFPSSIDLGTEEITETITLEDGSQEKITKIIDMTIPYIIKEMVHMYGGEPYYNIVINDLPDYGLELLEYRGKEPIYLITYNETGKKILSLKGDQTVYYEGGDQSTTVKELANLQIETGKTYLFGFGKDLIFTLERYEYGEAIGYRITDLIYPEDLIANIGDSITSILDKFVNMLGDYEYFYDLDGKFIFQKKKTYIQTAWSPQVGDHTGVNDFYIDPAAEASPIAYSFQNNYLVTAISNNPKLDNIKNDFSIWGTRKSVTEQELDVHMRYAIHSKPTQYCTIEVNQEEVNEFIKIHPEFKDMKPQEGHTYIVGDDDCKDWRELIYKMAQDYNKYSHLDNFEDKVAQANGNLYPAGRTGYEQYYIDMLGFWRLLYSPKALDEIKAEQGSAEYEQEQQNILDTYYLNDTKAENYGWARAIDQSPESLLFWIDFLDPAGELEKYSISTIGDRTKSVKDKDVKAIYYREVPNFIFYYPNEGINEHMAGYDKVQIQPTMSELFSISAQGKSAKDTLDEWLNQYLYGAESVNITGIPIYYLEPNTRIKISNDNVNLSGEYIIDKITLPLTYNGTMSISANKTVKMLY